MKLFIVLCAFVLCVSGSVTPKFPKCKKSDPNLNKCLVDGVETVRPSLIAGMPEVGIPAIDPYVLKPFEINRNDPSLKFKGTVEGMGYGGGAFKIDKLDARMKDKIELDLHLTIPSLDIAADYKTSELKLLAFNFAGKGKFSGKFTDVKAFVKVVATPYVKNGVEYSKLDNVSIKVKIADGKISVKDEKSPMLARAMAAFFNANPSTVLNIIGPVIDSVASDVVKDILEEAFDKIPCSEIVVN